MTRLFSGVLNVILKNAVQLIVVQLNSIWLSVAVIRISELSVIPLIAVLLSVI
jgi:hypothetical protein